MSDARAKLSWAERCHDEMQRLFGDFAKPGGGDERPHAIRFHAATRPMGLIVAKFGIDEAMPIEMSMLAAISCTTHLLHSTTSSPASKNVSAAMPGEDRSRSA